MDPFLVHITEMLTGRARHLEVLAYLQKVGEAAIDPYPDTPPEEQRTYCRLASRRVLGAEGLATPQDRALTILFLLRVLDLHMFRMLPADMLTYVKAAYTRDTMELGDAGSIKESARYKFVVTYEMIVGAAIQRIVEPRLYEYVLALVDTVDGAAALPDDGVDAAAAPAPDDAYGGVAPAQFLAAAEAADDDAAMIESAMEKMRDAAAPAPDAAAGPTTGVYEDDNQVVRLSIETLVALTPLWSPKKWMVLKRKMGEANRMNLAAKLRDAIRSQFDPAIQYEVVRRYYPAAVRDDPELYAHAGIPAEQDVEDWVDATGDALTRMRRRAMINDMETLADRWTLAQIYGDLERGALMYYELIGHAIDNIEARGMREDIREDEEREVDKDAIRIVRRVMPRAGRFSLPETLAMAFQHLVLQFYELRDMDRLFDVQMTRRTLAVTKGVAMFLITTIVVGWRTGVVEAHGVDDLLLPHRGAADRDPADDTDNDHLLSDLVFDAQEMLHLNQPGGVPRAVHREGADDPIAAPVVLPDAAGADFDTRLAEQHRLQDIAVEEPHEKDVTTDRLLTKRANLLEHLSDIRAKLLEPGDLAAAEKSVMLDLLAVRWKEYQTAAAQHADTARATERGIVFTRCWLPRCDAVAQWACLGCNMALYDSEQSQRADWVRHKPECRLIQEAAKDK